MKRVYENLKIGCRHSLVPSVEEQKQKFGHGTKAIEKTSHSKSYFTRFRRLISYI